MKLPGWLRRKPKIKPAQLGLDREAVPGIIRPETIRCPRCKRQVAVWRRYANGKVSCVPCASKR